MSTAPPIRSRPLVVVVDDDPVERLHSVAVLEHGGLDAVQAADGTEAIELVAQRRPDAVLLDVGLPGLDGIAVARALRERDATRTVPVLMVSGHGETTERVAGLEAGADDYLVKPVAGPELLARIRAQLRAAAGRSELLRRDLQERADASLALAGSTAGGSPATMAAELCAFACAARGFAAATVLTFGDRDELEVLATAGALHRGLARGVAPTLPEREVWSEEPGDPQRPLAELFGAADGQSVAVPLPAHRGAPTGWFVCGTAQPPADDAQRARTIALATEVAGHAASALSTCLEHRARLRAERHEIRAIIEHGAFRPVFQPIVELPTGHAIGFEALTRFDDGTRPDLRFAAASRVGLGPDLELATLERALWATTLLPRGAFVSVNVSAALVQEPGLVRSLLRSARRAIVLEITEHERITDYTAVRTQLDALPGVRVAVDDAGGGFASLRHVIELRPDFVKLDRGLVHGIDADPLRRSLVAGLTQFAHDSGCEIVAEGIETTAELDAVRDIGITAGQGWLFGRPCPAELAGAAAPRTADAVRGA
ncbi:EAL domain-containing protein [Conexibacter sp. W3-3-2]|uniref:EAL domain-containing protein n=1 Tax=Conexibacter sp. W3-3-2 TaxID=2675227 RepID=UPI0012B783A5|nr:EAL domain-containing protein [Conexibacter sp. W3-3-2]MTD46342.1 EAL domain-containing protein [Conexibacter sp. W3-3-2]